MDFLLGTKNYFLSFLESISKEDKIAILTHTDLDGLASGILIEEILKQKQLKCSYISFLGYRQDMFEEVIPVLKEKKITKVFVLDLNADQNEKNFEKLKKDFEVFLIDHHPINKDLKDNSNILKTETADCVTIALSELGKEIIDMNKWEWLVSATSVSEWSYKKKENFLALKKIYPDIVFEKAIDSIPGKVAIKINNATIYYKDNLKKVYNLIKQNKLEELDSISKIIDEEIKKELENFKKDAEFFSEKNIYFYKIKSSYPLNSVIATILSKTDDTKSFFIIADKKNVLNISARNQGEKDMNKLVKEGIKGIENATAGGHACASSAKIPKEQFKKFKENLLYYAI